MSKSQVRFEDDFGFSVSDKVTSRNFWIVYQHFPEYKIKHTKAVEQEPGPDEADFIVETVKGEKIRIEFKNWRIREDQIIIETHHDIHEDRPGWIEYGKYDYLVGCWHGNKVPAYIILDFPLLKYWWFAGARLGRQVEPNKPTTKEGVPRNTSGFVRVPIEDLPDKVIHTRKREFTLDDFW